MFTTYVKVHLRHGSVPGDGKIRLVQKALGHADLSTTTIYTHIVDEELEGAMKSL